MLVPSSLDPCKYGWYKDMINKLLLPVMIPPGCQAVPDQVLKIFNCKCTSAEPCSSKNCSCSQNKLSCSIFCACCDKTCYNEWTAQEEQDDNETVTDQQDGDDEEGDEE